MKEDLRMWSSFFDQHNGIDIHSIFKEEYWDFQVYSTQQGDLVSTGKDTGARRNGRQHGRRVEGVLPFWNSFRYW